MEWRWCLADLLTVAAGELFSHSPDDLPLARHRFQRPRDVFAKLAQAFAAAALTSCWRIDDYPFAGKMLRECLTLSRSACKPTPRRRPCHSLFRRKLLFSGIRFQVFEGQRQLLDD